MTKRESNEGRRFILKAYNKRCVRYGTQKDRPAQHGVGGVCVAGHDFDWSTTFSCFWGYFTTPRGRRIHGRVHVKWLKDCDAALAKAKGEL